MFYVTVCARHMCECVHMHKLLICTRETLFTWLCLHVAYQHSCSAPGGSLFQM